MCEAIWKEEVFELIILKHAGALGNGLWLDVVSVRRSSTIYNHDNDLYILIKAIGKIAAGWSHSVHKVIQKSTPKQTR